MLHGESITDQASPRTPTQRTFQPQEAVQPQRNQTILQADTPAKKANYSYTRSHPTPLEADAHTSHVHKNSPARAQSPGGRPPSTCTHRTSQPAEVVDATTIRTPPASCQLTGPTASHRFSVCNCKGVYVSSPLIEALDVYELCEFLSKITSNILHMQSPFMYHSGCA